MITPNDALQFIKDHHNGEIPYTFGKNEYARWMAEFANYTVTKHLHKLGVMQGCQCKDRIGETKVWCCNQCGLPCEDFWLPTHYTVGSRTVGKAGGDASVSDGK